MTSTARILATALLAGGALATAVPTATAGPAAPAGTPSPGFAVRAATQRLSSGKGVTGVPFCDFGGYVVNEHAAGGEGQPVSYRKGPATGGGPAAPGGRLVLLGYSCGAPGSGDGGTHAVISLVLVSSSGGVRVLARNAGEGAKPSAKFVSHVFFLQGIVSADTIAFGPHDAQCCPSLLERLTLARRGSLLAITSQHPAG